MPEIERLSAVIDADNSRALKSFAEVEAAANRVGRDRKSKIEVVSELDVSDEARTAAAARDRTVHIAVTWDRAALAALEAQLDAVTRDRKVEVKVDYDRSLLDAFNGGGGGGFDQALNGLLDQLNQIPQAASNAGNSLASLSSSATGALTSAIQSLTQQISQMGGAAQTAQGGVSGLSSSMSGLGSALGQIGQIAVAGIQFGLMATAIVSVIELIPALISGLQALVALIGGLVAAIFPLVGLLGALVPLIGVFAAAVGTIAMGFSGVGAAAQELEKMGKSAKVAGESAADAARRLAAAQRNLQAATRGVTQAEKELADAQKGVGQARKEAARDIVQAARDVTEALMSEQEAAWAVEDAQRALEKAQKGVGQSAAILSKETDDFTGKVYEVARIQGPTDPEADRTHDIEQAQHDLIRAQYNLEKSHRDVADAAEHKNDVDAKGIEGSDKVVAALDRVVAAQDRLASAHDALANAQDALVQKTDKTNASLANQLDAFNKLSPAGQDFARFINSTLMPALDQIKQAAETGLLPGIQAGLDQLIKTYLPWFTGQIKEYGGIIGDAFKDWVAFISTPEMQAAIKEIAGGLGEILKMGLGALKPLTSIIISVMQAAMPLAKLLTGALVDGLNKIADWMKKPENAKKMETFFTDAFYWMNKWMDVLMPLGDIFLSIMDAAKPLADLLLTEMANGLKELADYLKTPKGKKELQDFFTNAIPAIRETIGFIKDLFLILFKPPEGGGDTPFVQFMKGLREDILPAVSGILTALQKDPNAIPNLMNNLGSLAKKLQEFFEGEGWKEFKKFADKVFFILDGAMGIFNWFMSLQNTWWMDLIEMFTGSPQDFIARLTKWGLDILVWAKQAFLDIGKAWMDIVGIFSGQPIKDPNNPFLGIAKKFAEAVLLLGPLWNDLAENFSHIGINFQKIDLQKFQNVINEANHAERMREAQANASNLTPVAGGVNWGQPADLGPTYTPVPINYSGKLAHMQFGGSVTAGTPYVIGERRAELFIPNQNGRIAPTLPRNFGSQGAGTSAADLDRIMNAVLDKVKPNVDLTVNQNTHADPQQISRELAWALR